MHAVILFNFFDQLFENWTFFFGIYLSFDQLLFEV